MNYSISIDDLRKQFGEVYITIIPNGPVIPWKPLEVGDYIKYASISPTGIIPSYIEDEIFCKCVVDKNLIRQLDFLLAGIVSTTVQGILGVSGPTGIDSFNKDLEQTREEINGSAFAVLHEMVDTITKVFPYTPDDIYKMDYKTFLNRLVLSEKRLLQLGLIKEPIQVISTKEQPKKTRPKVDLKKLFDIQQQDQLKKKQSVVQPKNRSNPKLEDIKGTEKWWKVSPILEVQKQMKENIDFKTESAEINTFGMSGWDKVDQEILRQKHIKEAQKIYRPVLKELEKKRKK